MKLFTRKDALAEARKADEMLRVQSENVAKTLRAQIARINENNALHEQAVIAKQQSIALLNEEIRQKTVALRLEVEALERRREESLRPINDEIKTLRDERAVLAETIASSIEQQQKAQKLEELLREHEARFIAQQAAWSAAKTLEEESLLAAHRDAKSETRRVKVTLKSLQKEEERLNALRDEQLKTLAELAATKAETSAQLRSVRQERGILEIERVEVDKQKQELATIIAILRQKGLWQQVQEMTTSVS